MGNEWKELNGRERVESRGKRQASMVLVLLPHRVSPSLYPCLPSEQLSVLACGGMAAARDAAASPVLLLGKGCWGVQTLKPWY